ncbi:hypothetical protein DCF38_10955 [Edwardsiella piscicida]|uniref:hypothetical protein n=1 Tax=Edwardsiella piscicida TaxID=1263550 RepID=UPI000D515C08|nr:hypothetical protein [Edwardsiella piscicida]UCQ40055.1 hypothetical protein DCF38_10955 [Edwardsiella piscicida]
MAFDKSQIECLINRHFGTDIRINNKTVRVIFEQDIIFFDENTQATVLYFTAQTGVAQVGSTFFYGDTYRITRIEDDLSGIANYYYIEIKDGNNGI